MGYMTCMGPCAACNKIFAFNPYRVPSMLINGVKEPICRECVERYNEMRIEHGLSIFNIPEGAYEAEEIE